MAMDMSTEMTINGQAPPAPKILTIRMFMDVEVTEVTATNFRYNFVYNKVTLDESADTPPQLISTLQGSLQSIVGLSGYGVVDARGFSKEAESKTPPGLAPNLKQLTDGMKQSLHQLTTPLPEEPVGKGAKWKSEQNLIMNGMSIKQSTIFTPLSREGNQITISTQLVQTAPEQEALPFSFLRPPWHQTSTSRKEPL
jgi:hypothetical protein